MFLFISFLLSLQAHAAPTRVLLTAFEPFGGSTVNSSKGMVEAYVTDYRAHHPNPEVELYVAILPVVWGKAENKLNLLIDTLAPEIVISFGEAGGWDFRVETMARNRDDSMMPDNEGKIRRNAVIVKRGPKVYGTHLPAVEILKDLKAGKFPARLSDNAGSFLCNHLFYHLMYRMAKHPGALKEAGFVHVPTTSAANMGPQGFQAHSEWGKGAVRAVLTEALSRLPR